MGRVLLVWVDLAADRPGQPEPEGPDAEQEADEGEEVTDEEVQAYIDVGEEEGGFDLGAAMVALER